MPPQRAAPWRSPTFQHSLDTRAPGSLFPLGASCTSYTSRTTFWSRPDQQRPADRIKCCAGLLLAACRTAPPPPPASCGSQTSLPLCAPLLHHGTRAPPTGMALTRPRATLQAVPRTICRPLPRTAAPPAHPVHAASCRASQLSHFWLSMWTKVGPSKPPPCAREAGATAPPAVGGCHKGTASGCTSATRQGKAHPLTIAGSQTQLVEGVDAPWVKAPLPASSASTHRMSNAGQ